MEQNFTLAKYRLNGSMGCLQVNGENWGEVSELHIRVEMEYEDVRRGLDIDKKLTGRRGTGSMRLTRAFTRAAEILESSEGKESVFRIVAWIADPDSYGAQEERIAIDGIKFKDIDLFGFIHGETVKDSYEFYFMPGDLRFLDRIEE